MERQTPQGWEIFQFPVWKIQGEWYKKSYIEIPVPIQSISSPHKRSPWVQVFSFMEWQGQNCPELSKCTGKFSYFWGATRPGRMILWLKFQPETLDISVYSLLIIHFLPDTGKATHYEQVHHLKICITIFPFPLFYLLECTLFRSSPSPKGYLVIAAIKIHKSNKTTLWKTKKSHARNACLPLSVWL